MWFPQRVGPREAATKVTGAAIQAAAEQSLEFEAFDVQLPELEALAALRMRAR